MFSEIPGLPFGRQPIGLTPLFPGSQAEVAAKGFLVSSFSGLIRLMKYPLGIVLFHFSCEMARGRSLLTIISFCNWSLFVQTHVQAKIPVAFECTKRQAEEDHAMIASNEYRFHQAMVRLGVCALRADKIDEGRIWLEKAAALGDPEAMNNLAVMFSGGIGLEQDLARAHQLFLDAADQGCSDAMHNLGIMYDTGRGGFVSANATKAASWFVKAADRNHYEAMHALALMEVAGRGVAVNLEQAARRFKRLAQSNVDPPYPNARYMLALLLINGSISRQFMDDILPISGDYVTDRVLGMRLMRTAADAGHPQAYVQLQKLLDMASQPERPKLERLI
jgi:TPR repeat protein